MLFIDLHDPSHPSYLPVLTCHHSCPGSFCSSNSGHLTILHTHQKHSCFRAFALAVPSAWRFLPCKYPNKLLPHLPLGLYSKVIFSARFSPAALSKLRSHSLNISSWCFVFLLIINEHILYSLICVLLSVSPTRI